MFFDDSTQKIWIADTGSHLIHVVYEGMLTTIAGGGTGGVTATNVNALTATLSSPNFVKVYNGYLYICDSGSHTVKKVDLSTNVLTIIAGTGTVSSATQSNRGNYI